MKRLAGLLAFLLLAVVTQIGALVFVLCWAISRFALPGALQGWRRACVNAALFVVLYAAATFGLVPAWAALGGRVALPCYAEPGRPFAAGHPLYCVLNRHYVEPRLATLLTELSRQVDRAHPGTTTLYLDGNFPFLDGFPLLPHLSHNDGRKLDLAYYYQTPNGAYRPGELRSPVGYWAYEQPGR